MKSVLISIRPEWCEKIASGQKTIEVRKTRPKLETPFKCYIYCTQGSPLLAMCDLGYFKQFGRHPKEHFEGVGFCKDFLFKANGKVIGEFVCDYITILEPVGGVVYCSEYERACMTPEEIVTYANGHQLYAWHISDLVIYDKPKGLNEFYKKNPCEAYSPIKDVCDLSTPCVEAPNHLCRGKRLTRPPQSWCYVEVLK